MLTFWHRACAAALVLLACVGAAYAAAPYPSLRVSIVKPAASPHDQTAEALVDQPATTETEAVTDKTPPVPENGLPHTSEVITAIPVVAAPEPFTAPIPIAKTWSVTLSDDTVRQALARWAMDAGWTMSWEVPVDIPLTAGADLATTPDFHEAVAVLADAVAMGETPIRPCFYANQVVRLLPYNAVCDRTGTRPPSPNP